MEELRTLQTSELTDKKLKDCTNKIRRCGENIRKNYIKIAYVLNEVKTSECYLNDGFADVQEYASTVLGIQKTTCYNLLNIGADYINEDGTRTILTTEGGDYGVSQLQALLPLGVDEVKTLHEQGIISPSMSVRKLKEIVDENKTVKPKEEDENTVEGEAVSETEETIPVVGIINLLADGDITTNGDIPEKFYEQLKEFYNRCFIDGKWQD